MATPGEGAGHTLYTVAKALGQLGPSGGSREARFPYAKPRSVAAAVEKLIAAAVEEQTPAAAVEEQTPAAAVEEQTPAAAAGAQTA